MIVDYLKIFCVGGFLCLIAQILLDKTKLTAARILVLYVVTGVVLTGIGLYEKLVNFASFGATIPLLGFGYSLCKGVFEAVDTMGFMGIFTGGLKDVAIGIVTAVFLALCASLISKPKSKKM